MFSSKIYGCVLLALGCMGRAYAAPVHYEGSLTSGVSVVGTVGGYSWFLEVAPEVDFWRFNGIAGKKVTIEATRAMPELDPAFSLYFGVTTADEALFLNDADWGGMSFLTFADDEIPNPGPGGDPALTLFVLPFTGSYTIALGGFQSDTSGPYSYSLSLVAQPIPNQPIPEPESLLLMVTGMCVMAGLFRRRAAVRWGVY